LLHEKNKLHIFVQNLNHQLYVFLVFLMKFLLTIISGERDLEWFSLGDVGLGRNACHLPPTCRQICTQAFSSILPSFSKMPLLFSEWTSAIYALTFQKMIIVSLISYF
jgi:hypothetical protein